MGIREVRYGALMVLLLVFGVAITAAVANRATGSNTGSTHAYRALHESNLELAPRNLTGSSSVGAGASWTTIGGDLGQNQYSRLSQINKSNVDKLDLAWSSTYAGTVVNEVETEPVEYHGVLYFVDGQGNLEAADATSGAKIWTWTAFSGQSPGLARAIRGVAIGDGNVYMTTTQGVVVAIYASTGTLNWQTNVNVIGPTNVEGEAAPVYYKGKLFVSVAGFENGRGHVDCLDAATGKLLWRTFVVLGSNDPATGGGGVWTSVSLDPRLGLVYASTGNDTLTLLPGAVAAPGNQPWTSSLVALDMSSGAIKWGFQGVHHDQWDYDCPEPPNLFTIKMKGVVRNGVTFQCKAGYLFELDRSSGTPLIPVKEVPIPQAPGGSAPDPATIAANPLASLTQPIPASDRVTPACSTSESLPGPAPDGGSYAYSCVYSLPGAGHFIAYTPGFNGGADQQPTALDPRTGYLYECQIANASQAFKSGTVAPAGKSTAPPAGWSGTVAAVNLANGKVVWLDKWMNGKTCFSGVLATAGGLVFAADTLATGPSTLYAFDSATGKELWEYHTNQPIADAPIAYRYKGHEYIAIMSGGSNTGNGGITDPSFVRNDAMWVFALPTGALPGKPAPGATTPGTTPSSGDNGAGAAYPQGKTLFVSNCGSCHALAAAGTTGTIGPNLATLGPLAPATVVSIVTNGVGAKMPSFTGTLTADQISQVANYLSTATGGAPH
jgi:alcohol dehydrogenase (cytochrome c)